MVRHLLASSKSGPTTSDLVYGRGHREGTRAMAMTCPNVPWLFSDQHSARAATPRRRHRPMASRLRELGDDFLDRAAGYAGTDG